MQRIAAIAGTIRRTVRPKRRAILVAGRPSRKPLRTAARKTAVPVEESGRNSTIAFS